MPKSDHPTLPISTLQSQSHSQSQSQSQSPSHSQSHSHSDSHSHFDSQLSLDLLQFSHSPIPFLSSLSSSSPTEIPNIRLLQSLLLDLKSHKLAINHRLILLNSFLQFPFNHSSTTDNPRDTTLLPNPIPNSQTCSNLSKLSSSQNQNQNQKRKRTGSASVPTHSLKLSLSTSLPSRTSSLLATPNSNSNANSSSNSNSNSNPISISISIPNSNSNPDPIPLPPLPSGPKPPLAPPPKPHYAPPPLPKLPPPPLPPSGPPPLPTTLFPPLPSLPPPPLPSVSPMTPLRAPPTPTPAPSLTLPPSPGPVPEHSPPPGPSPPSSPTKPTIPSPGPPLDSRSPSPDSRPLASKRPTPRPILVSQPAVRAASDPPPKPAPEKHSLVVRLSTPQVQRPRDKEPVARRSERPRPRLRFGARPDTLRHTSPIGFHGSGPPKPGVATTLDASAPFAYTPRQLCPPPPLLSTPPSLPKTQGEVAQDFSKAKLPTSQVPMHQFMNWVNDHYLRSFGEDDLAFLASDESGASCEPALGDQTGQQQGWWRDLPRLGRHYSELWREEDMGITGTSQDSTVIAGGGRAAEPAGDGWVRRRDVRDTALREESIGVGPLAERLVSAVLPLRQPRDKCLIGKALGGGGIVAGEVELEVEEEMEVGEMERRLKRELRYIGLLGENEEVDWQTRADDEISMALRSTQSTLARQSQVNKQRKKRLSELVRGKLAVQEYEQIKEGLDRLVEQAFVRRTKVAVNGQKNKNGNQSGGMVNNSQGGGRRKKSGVMMNEDSSEIGSVVGSTTSTIMNTISNTNGTNGTTTTTTTTVNTREVEERNGKNERLSGALEKRRRLIGQVGGALKLAGVLESHHVGHVGHDEEKEEKRCGGGDGINGLGLGVGLGLGSGLGLDDDCSFKVGEKRCHGWWSEESIC